MLHALLHGKLDPARPEPHRIEDALTSTVFGALIWAGEWETLSRWLGVPYAAVSSQADYECWFWPRLGSVEPDVVIRVAHELIVVEAKYRSGRHDLREPIDEEDVRPSDQLARQFLGMSEPIGNRARYDEKLENAIANCRLVQVYVVDAQRLVRARRECDESRARLPAGAFLEIATWQSLYRILGAPDFGSHRWATDLKAYLALSGLDSFQGVRRGMALAPSLRPALRWRAQSRATGFTGAAHEAMRAPVASLLQWRQHSRRSVPTRELIDWNESLVIGAAAATIATWCHGWEEEPHE